MRVIVMKSAKRDYKNLPPEVKNKVKKIIKQIRKGTLNPEKLTDIKNIWKIKTGNYRIVMEKIKGDFHLQYIELRKDVYKNL